MLLPTKLSDGILRLRDELAKKGEILSNDEINRYCDSFRDRFGPDKLAGMDGETLVDAMHNSSNPDSMVYWLEFKNDDEFPSPKFGSIAGGSALKFGLYKRKETGAWTTGSPMKQRERSIDEAAVIAKNHREQLIKGIRLLERLSDDPSDSHYAELQKRMDSEAPSVGDTAWGHKYFSLVFPEKMDFFHNPDYQRFHLIKLLQTPPELEGRYVCAGRYVAIAKELGLHLRNLGRILWQMNPKPHRYWRIGTKLDGVESRWDLMRENGCVAVGFSEVGDLAGLQYKREDKEMIKSRIAIKYPGTPSQIGKKTQQLFNFAATIREGDLVVPSDGETVLGIGKVIGDYFYVENSDAPHRLPVMWLSFDEWKIRGMEGLRTTVKELKRTENLMEIERKIHDSKPSEEQVSKMAPANVRKKLEGIPGRIQSILERKGQAILYGPPGTGKTYWAERAAKDLASFHKFGRPYGELTEDEKTEIFGNSTGSQGLVRICTFHPAYGYEDFIEGFRPRILDDRMVFQLTDGILKKLCGDAAKHAGDRYYLIVDEINRGDIPRIFGELLTIMEKDKRGKPLLLSGSGASFFLPENVFIIGAMNTADRSIALLDAALRRRFGFVELMPDSSVFGDAVVEGIPLGPWLDSLNSKILEHIGRDARNLQIGHSYLLDKGKPVDSCDKLAKVVRDDIVPLLEEYCYEDYRALLKILGKGFVDEGGQRIRHELFEASMKDEFVQAMKSIDPSLASSTLAVLSEARRPEEEEEEDAENGDGTFDSDETAGAR